MVAVYFHFLNNHITTRRGALNKLSNVRNRLLAANIFRCAWLASQNRLGLHHIPYLQRGIVFIKNIIWDADHHSTLIPFSVTPQPGLPS